MTLQHRAVQDGTQGTFQKRGRVNDDESYHTGFQISDYYFDGTVYFSVLSRFFSKKDDEAREYLFLRQNMLMFAMHFVAYTVLYLEQTGVVTCYCFTVRRRFIWRQCLCCSGICIRWLRRLLINNMCMLITVPASL